MKLTRADISFAQHVAFVKQFPSLAANNQIRFSSEAIIHGCINSHTNKTSRKTWGENWHNTLAIIHMKIRRNEDWKILEHWTFEGAYGPRHKTNVLRLLRRIK